MKTRGNWKHGGKGLPEYGIWKGIKQRCYDPNYPAFHRYGGRGITVCDRWRHDFATFLADMGPRPSKRHSIERKENGGPYSPVNCCWDTRTAQANNRRTNRLLVYRDRPMTLRNALDLAGTPITYASAQKRLKLGWSVRQAVETSRYASPA